MKTLSVILLSTVLFMLPAAAQNRITLTITVTNPPVSSNSITINGVTRMWTNAEAATTILTNLTGINPAKTNAFRQFSRWSWAGPLNLVDVGSNSFKLVGPLSGALAASSVGTWATLALSTQSGAGYTYTALYPLENMVDPTDRVNQASSLVYGEGLYSTNAFPTNSTAVSNLLNKGASPLQRVRGQVSFDNFAGTNTGLIIPSNAVNGYVLVTDGNGIGRWSNVYGSMTNTSISIATNGGVIDAGITQLNLIAGNNIRLTGTNVTCIANVGVNLETNLTFVTESGTMIVGHFGNKFGISNATLGELSFWLDDPSSDDEWNFKGNIVAGGSFYGTNVQLTAIPGTGSFLGITAGGTTFRTNLPASVVSNALIGIGQTLYLDPSFGNDATAGRTNAAAPFLTASNAFGSLLTGDTLVMRGGTNVFNPRTGIGALGSGLCISNKSNFRIVGEPGSVLRLGSRYFTNGASSGGGLLFVNCTNFVLEGLTIQGFRTNGAAWQDAGIFMSSCAQFTFRNLKVLDWQDHGIASVNPQCDASDGYWEDVTIQDTGSATNVVGLGIDGAACNVLCSNFTLVRPRFIRNVRDFEIHTGIIKNIRLIEPYSEGCRGSSLIFNTSSNIGLSDVKVVNGTFIASATNTISSPLQATLAEIETISNFTFQGNTCIGYAGAITYGYGGTVANSTCTDITLDGNLYVNFFPIGHYLVRAIGTPATLERVTIKNEKWKTLGYYAIALNANNSVIANNQMADCALLADPSGAIIVGYNGTNCTNIVVSGNNIYNSALSSLATYGINITASCFSNIVFDNTIDRCYTGGITNNGTLTRGRPVNMATPNSLNFANSAGDDASFTNGAGTNMVLVSLNSQGRPGWTNGLTLAQLDVTGTLTTSNLALSGAAAAAITNIATNAVRLLQGTNIVIVTNLTAGGAQYTIHSTASGGGGTPGGANRSVQWNSNSVFQGNSAFQYDPISTFVEFFGPTLSINNGVNTNVIEPTAFGTVSPTKLTLVASNGTPRWDVSVDGHFVPSTFSNRYDIGSATLSVRTQWVNAVIAVGGSGTNATNRLNGETIFDNGISFQSWPTTVQTNFYTTTTNLDFGAVTVGAFQDIPVYLSGSADGDDITVTPGLSALTNLAGGYQWFGSNNYVYVRFVSTGTAQNPGAGTFRVTARKFR